MRKNVLMVTHSAVFKHDYLPTAQKVVKSLGEQTGFFDAVATDDCAALNEEELKKFDAIFFATSGELPISDKNKTDLINSIKAGKGFIGVHNATDTFYKFPAYGEMIGGYFNGHPWTQNVVVKVEDRTHPSTKHLPPSFKVKEEIYTYRDWSRDKTHTLISLDNKSVDMCKGNREDHDYALCWCHKYGHGRVFYTGFGHFTELWNESWFRTHLIKGILWAMKLTE